MKYVLLFWLGLLAACGMYLTAHQESSFTFSSPQQNNNENH